MSLGLSFRAGTASFDCRLTWPDWGTATAIGAHLPSEVDLVFNAPDEGQAVSVNTAELRDAVKKIDEFLVAHPELLPYTYQYKVAGFPFPNDPGHFDTGGLSGIQLPGDLQHWYSIDCGLNECQLTKMAIGGDGVGVVVERRDLHSERELITSNFGTIVIRRQRVKSSLRQILAEIHEFISTVSLPTVIKAIG